MSREWYRFFLNIFNLTGGGNNQTSLDDLQLAPPFVPSTGGGSGTVTSVDVVGGTTGLTTSGGPVTTSGTITIAGTLNVANGGTGATTAAGAPFALKNANSDITSLSGLTGPISSPTYVQFGSGSGTTLVAGRMWYDNSTGSLNFGMGNGNITQQVGEELFIYGKASTAITDSPLQIVYHTGTVGASGVITFAPTVAGITDVNAILGIATENLALNAFGRITAFGVVHGITTNGTAFGETWADDDVIWYNPVTGNPTKVEPVAPYIKVQIGLVINAGSGGSGSFQVGVSRGSKLGGTDSNVQFGTLANNNLIAYDSTLGYWKNVTSSSLGFVTSVTGTSPVVSSGGTTPAISLAASYGDTQNPYASKTANYILAAPNGAAGVPTFRAVVAADIPTLNQNTTGTASNVTGIVAVANGGSGTATPALVAGTNVSITGSWPNQTINSSNPGGTVTSVAATVPSFLSVTGSPITSSGTLAISYSGTALPILNGGTGQTTASAAFNALSPMTTLGDTVYGAASGAGTRLAGNTTATKNFLVQTGTGTVSAAPSWGTIAAADVPTLNQNTTGTASNVTGTVAILNGGTGQTTAAAGFNALSPVTSTGDLIIGNGTNSATRLAIGAINYVLTSNGTTATWAVATGSGATITNDTTTSTNVYPLFAAATSGSLATAYTSNANYLYKPSTGELTSLAMICSNGIQVNSKTVSVSYTIATGNSGMSAGPITIASGKAVTVSSGSRWVIL